MTFRQFFRIVEIRTKVVSISTFSLAVLYSAWRTGAVRLWETLICFVAVFLVDMGTTAFNSYSFQAGRDAAPNKEEDKVLLHERVRAQLLIAMGASIWRRSRIILSFWSILDHRAGAIGWHGFLY